MLAPVAGVSHLAAAHGRPIDSSDAVLRTAFPLRLLPELLSDLSPGRTARGAPPRRHSLRKCAVLRLERAAVRAGGAGVRAGRSSDRASYRKPAATITAGTAAA